MEHKKFSNNNILEIIVTVFLFFIMAFLFVKVLFF